MPMWSMHERTTEEQARKNRGRSNDGKITEVEDTTTSDDAWYGLIRLAGSGVVYDSTFSKPRTSGSS